MSLLLQALQKAAKNRDDSTQDSAAQDDGGDDLTLEPLAEPQLNKETGPVDERPTGPASSPEDAAGVMRASEIPSYSALEWARDHYMLTFLASAVLFAIVYGLYVYIQISNPGLFRSAPVPMTAPIQATAQPASPPASQLPRISGLPDAAPAGALQVGQAALAATAGDDIATRSVPQPATLGTTGNEPMPAVTTPARARPQVVPATRPPASRSISPRRITTTVDSDGVEVVEIPVAPSVSVLPETKATETKQDNISVQMQDSLLSPIDPVLMMAYDALQLGNYEKASQLYQQVLSRAPGSIDAMLGLAAITWKQGRPDVASRYYGRVLEINPRNAHAQAGLIAILGNADPIAAESKLKQLIGQEPSGFLYFTLGNLYAERELWAQAQRAYFQAYQFQPDNSDYAFNLAVGLEHLGKTRPALDYYRKALDLSFRKGRANFDQGLAIERVGQLSARVE